MGGISVNAIVNIFDLVTNTCSGSYNKNTNKEDQAGHF